MPNIWRDLLVETGQRMGKNVVALITDMDQPLGRTAGNALEIDECIEVLGAAAARPICASCVSS